jgi:glycine/D-amino acid oxidase-like deaminating enzyme
MQVQDRTAKRSHPRNTIEHACRLSPVHDSTAVSSLWLDQAGGPSSARPTLVGDMSVDVAIIGGGYTGLWTAYSLLHADPSSKVLVIERETAGFGASGRNGGWCVGELAGGLDGAVSAYGRSPGIELTRAIVDTVDEVGRAIAAEAIDCGFAKGGVVRLARNEVQRRRQQREAALFVSHGFGDDVELLDAPAARARLAATDVVGGFVYRPAARIQPMQLALGLAAAVERRGGTIVEHTTVEAIRPAAPGRGASVVTDRGVVTADVVVRATEAYTRDLPGHRRSLVPLYSLMIATEPLPAEMWEQIGLREREVFADDRHMVIYGQRTTDDRMAFGGRGANYGWGSTIDPALESNSHTHARIAAVLRELFPILADVAITHRWGGVLGVPRDWRPSVGFDRATGLAWAGGYVGEGVAASNLAGRTLADLIAGTASPLTSLPWVDHRSRRWEPEPLRWIGINGLMRVADRADRIETATGRPSRLAAALDHFIG